MNKKHVQVKAKNTMRNHNQTFVKKEVILAVFLLSAGLVFFY